MCGCCAPTFGTAGPRLPAGRALTPRAALPTQSPSRAPRTALRSRATAKGAKAEPDETSHACRSLRSAPNPEPPERGRSGGLTPPPQAPAAALRRARPPPSDVGRAPHTALRAPPWAFTQHRACSHHPRNVSAHALSSPRGIGILAPAPRCEGHGATREREVYN